MRRTSSAALSALLLCGCAGSLWPPQLAAGNSEHCEKQTLYYRVDGTLERVDRENCTSGGAISKTAAEAVRGVIRQIIPPILTPPVP